MEIPSCTQRSRNNNVSIENETDWLQMANFHADWTKKFYDVIVPYIQQAEKPGQNCKDTLAFLNGPYDRVRRDSIWQRKKMKEPSVPAQRNT